MKRLYSLAITAFFIHASLAAPVIRAITNGYWGVASTWDLNRVPQAGDTILIGTNKTVTIDDDQNIGGATVVKINGKLRFANNNSTLKLSNLGSIWVFTNARIEGGGSPSQKIKIGNSQVFDGSDAAIVGPEMADAATNGFDPFVDLQALPVKFLAFTTIKNKTDVQISWSTAEEMNVNVYEIERSSDGLNWNKIAYVASKGSTQNTNSYTYIDKNISAGVLYYRVKEVDIDGNFSYTSISSVKSETIIANNIKIAAVQNKVVLQFPEEIKGAVVVRFVSLNGQVLEQQTVNHATGQVILTSKTKGNQIISLSNGSSVNLSKHVVL
jgi:hypothetical protein